MSDIYTPCDISKVPVVRACLIALINSSKSGNGIPWHPLETSMITLQMVSSSSLLYLTVPYHHTPYIWRRKKQPIFTSITMQPFHIHETNINVINKSGGLRFCTLRPAPFGLCLIVPPSSIRPMFSQSMCPR